MRMSRLFGRTLREAPAGVEGVGEQMLVRAGFVREVASGIYAVLPLGQRALSRLEARLAGELQSMNGQEVILPALYGAEWYEEGMLQPLRTAATSVGDRQGRQYILGGEAAAVMAELAAGDVRSYRQLPVLVYGRRRAWLDDRGKGGLLDARESPTIESYGLAPGEDAAASQLAGQRSAYDALFRDCGVPVVWVHESGEQLAAMYLSSDAGRSLLLCPECGYAATAETAAFARAPAAPEPLLAPERVATPHTKTIADLARFLGIPESKTAKAVFLMASRGRRDTFVFAVVRGDLDISEEKLAGALGAPRLRAATEAEIRATGATPGYASPIGLGDVFVVVDESISGSANLAAGANEEGYHLLNTNLGRDYEAALVADIALAPDGAGCPRCGAPLQAATGSAIVHLARLLARPGAGDRPTYLDLQGRSAAIVMTASRVDLLRLLAATADSHRDDHGLIWPPAVAPYDVHLVSLGGGEAECEELYAALQEAGLAALLDDRGDSPGVKFNDADLIGLPVRLTVGKRSLQQGGVELKCRSAGERTIVPLQEIVARVREELGGVAGTARTSTGKT